MTALLAHHISLAHLPLMAVVSLLGLAVGAGARAAVWARQRRMC